MKTVAEPSVARRWYVGFVSIIWAAGPIAGLSSLSRWAESHYGAGWLSFSLWLLLLTSLVFWPICLPGLLRRILRSDAGLEEPRLEHWLASDTHERGVPDQAPEPTAGSAGGRGTR